MVDLDLSLTHFQCLPVASSFLVFVFALCLLCICSGNHFLLSCMSNIKCFLVTLWLYLNIKFLMSSSVVSRVFLGIPLHVPTVNFSGTEGHRPWFGVLPEKELEFRVSTLI